jgi:hypothetical protein
MDEESYRCVARDADGGLTLVDGDRTERIAPPVSDEAMFAAVEAFFAEQG